MAIENADGGAPRNPGGARRDDFADFPRDQWGRPKIIRAELNPATGRWEVPTDADGNLIKELVSFTRASTLGGAIEYQGGLHRWKAAVVAWGIARSRTLAKRARAVASYSRREDKDELYEIIDKAQAFAESDAAADHGTALHSVFRRIAEGETVDDLIELKAIDEEDVPACRAFAEAIEPWVVVYAERHVVCDEAQAAGKYDIVVTPRRPMPVTDAKGVVVAVIWPGDLVAVDNKTSSSADYFGEKFAVQLWCYVFGRAYNKQTGERTETGVRKDWALILHIPSGSEEGTVAAWHWVNLELGGQLVKVARDVLEGRKLGKRAIVAADLDAEIPAELLERSAGQLGTERAAQDRRERADAVGVTIHQADLGPITPSAACCDTWHPDGTTCPDPYLVPEPAQPGEVCEIHGEHLGTVDCPECLFEYKAHPNAPQWAGGPGMSFETWHGIRLAAEELKRKTGATASDRAMGARFSPIAAEAGGSGFGTVTGTNAVCRCVTPTCDECLHIPGCVLADDPVTWCEHEAGELCPPGTPCRQRAHFPAKCPGSGKTYAPAAVEPVVDPVAEAEVCAAEVNAALSNERIDTAATVGVQAVAESLAQRLEASLERHGVPVVTGDLAQDMTLAQRLQGAAERNRQLSDWERARAYLIRKIKGAKTEAEILDLWKRGKKLIDGRQVWARPTDPEADELARARKAELGELEPTG